MVPKAIKKITGKIGPALFILAAVSLAILALGGLVECFVDKTNNGLGDLCILGGTIMSGFMAWILWKCGVDSWKKSR